MESRTWTPPAGPAQPVKERLSVRQSAFDRLTRTAGPTDVSGAGVLNQRAPIAEGPMIGAGEGSIQDQRRIGQVEREHQNIPTILHRPEIPPQSSNLGLAAPVVSSGGVVETWMSRR